MATKYSKQLVKKLGLTFPILSDPGSVLLEKLGIVFDLDPALVEVYRNFGTDLTRFNQEESWRLPLPGRIVIAKDGIVRDAEFGIDHQQRPEPTESLAILRDI